MKIVFISDTHLQHKGITLPKGDVLVHCGDVSLRGTFTELAQFAIWFEEQRERFTHRILVAGNHDFGFYQAKSVVLDTIFDKDIIYLEDSEVIIDGIKFYGSPWVTKFYDWAFMKLDEDLQPHWDNIPTDTDVLITHGPPKSILDKNRYGDECGSQTLYNKVATLPRLKIHAFGHIHEGYGIEKIHKTKFINCAILNGNYALQNKPVVVTLNSE